MTSTLIFNDYAADWCRPCKDMEPILYELKDIYGFTLNKINVDDDTKAAQDNGIMSIPTLIVTTQDGVTVERMVGFQTKAKLEALIKKYLVGKNG